MTAQADPLVALRDAIRGARKAQQPPLTQEALAAKLGVPRRTALRWESKNGRNQVPSVKHEDPLVDLGVPRELIHAARAARDPSSPSLDAELREGMERLETHLQEGLATVEHRLIALLERQSRLLDEMRDLLAKQTALIERLAQPQPERKPAQRAR